MIRNIFATGILLAASLANVATQAAQPAPLKQLEGTWIAVTPDYSTSQAGLFMILQIGGGGQIALTMKNKLGMSVTTFGNYTYNATAGALKQEWVDYEPKVPCVIEPCHSTPPLPLDIRKTETVTFANPNFMTLYDLPWSRWQ